MPPPGAMLPLAEACVFMPPGARLEGPSCPRRPARLCLWHAPERWAKANLPGVAPARRTCWRRTHGISLVHLPITTPVAMIATPACFRKRKHGTIRVQVGLPSPERQRVAGAWCHGCAVRSRARNLLSVSATRGRGRSCRLQPTRFRAQFCAGFAGIGRKIEKPLSPARPEVAAGASTPTVPFARENEVGRL